MAPQHLHRARRLAVFAAVLPGVLILAACAPAAPSPTPSALTPSPMASATTASPSASPIEPPADESTGLAAPWSIVVVDDSVLISERDTGRILERTASGEVREVAILGDVVHGGEGGLLGLAVRGGALFVYSTGQAGNRVQRFPLTGSPGSIGVGASTTIIDGLPAGRTHNGGRIDFGPDDALYISVGDAGDPSAAPDLDSLGGKILRVMPDGSVPSDNPFPGSPVYSLGHRNVQGLAWDDGGRLFASEFGQNTWDELNIIEPGGDYGWPRVEGAGGSAQGFIDPVQQWATDAASPSGIAIVAGTVFVANLRGEVLRSIPVADPAASVDHVGGVYGRLRDVTVGPDGRLWILTNNTDGRGDARGGDDRIVSIDVRTLVP